jgi:molybdopterin converting factor small subunit
MFICKVHLYGLDHKLTTARDVDIELEDGASIAQVIAGIKKKIPQLDGPVFIQGEDRLGEGYKFNVNGHFYFDGMDFQLHPGDRIALLLPASGG